MANNFYVFNENENNIMSLSEYSSSTTRQSGVVSGIADSRLHNRLYHQVSIMVSALGQILDDAGETVDDSSLVSLVSALKNVLATKSSGALTVSTGGTGNTSFTSNAILTGNGTNAIVAKPTSNGAAYATSANGQLTFGTLPVAQGGTGNTSVDTTPTASSTKMVTSGGVKSALDAKQDDYLSRTATLALNSWNNNQQTATVSGVTTSNLVVVSPTPASIEAWGEAGVYCSAQSANSLTFKCKTRPAEALTANVVIWN